MLPFDRRGDDPLSIASIALPRIFRIGGGASKQLPEVLASLGLSRPLIVTDAYLESSGRVAKLTDGLAAAGIRSEEHTSELQSLMRISYAVFCLQKKNTNKNKKK